tara:strand:- start:53 stop:1030 length:978 start_codon:yes stop_codon:yes gene_type:complete
LDTTKIKKNYWQHKLYAILFGILRIAKPLGNIEIKTGMFNFNKMEKPFRTEINQNTQEKTEYYEGFYVFTSRFVKNLLIIEDYSRIEKIISFFNSKKLNSLSLDEPDSSTIAINNLGFLEKFKNIEYLIIGIDDDKLNLDPINSLKQLNHLSLNKEYKTPPKLSSFDNLKHLNCTYTNRKWDNLFECDKLVSLGLLKYKSENLLNFKSLTNLKELSISTCNVQSLKGIEKCQSLKKLILAYFRNITQIEQLPNSLKHLELSNFPKIHNINFARELENLIHFDIENCKEIDSLKPTKQLIELIRLRVIGNTRIKDGDYSFERWKKN